MLARLIAVMLLSLCVLAVASVAAEFGLDPKTANDSVHFRSTAKLEFIEGETSDLTGGFALDPTEPTAVTGVLRVDLKTLRTGIETRDEHMRERHLHTEDYPFAFFEIESASDLPPSLQPGNEYTGKISGLFYIHGIKRELTADLQVITSPGDDISEIDIRATFSIELDDYKIPRPKLLFLKLSKVIEVEVMFTAFKDLQAEAIELPDWELLD